jgi:peptidyl-prolyl cis-trans isomerase D
MLSSIRNKTKGWIAYLIIGLIIVPFALFGVSEYFTGSSNVIVASIDGEGISKEDFAREFNDNKRRLQQELGEKYTPELNRAVKLTTIQSIVNRSVLKQLASQSGYVTTPRELRAFIQSNNEFKVDGKFSFDKYKQLLRLSGLSDVEYESLQLEELTQNQIQNNFLDSAFITPSALKRIQQLNDQQREFSYMMLSVDDYLHQAKVDTESIKGFYQTQKQAFFEPKKVKVDFIKLSLKEIAKNFKVNEDDLLNFYEDEKARFTTDEERKAQHILVESSEQADALVAKLDKGEDFADLAAEHSQDTGSKANGGDLGFFTLGAMVPEFESKVFSMKAGETSVPVKSDFGYHIIKLNAIKVATVKSFDLVRDELTKLYIEREVQKSLYDLTEQLANLAYETNLEEAAEQMDLSIQTSEFFTENSQQYDGKFVAAAYNDVVLNKGENSELIELSKDEFVVLRINKKVAQRQKEFKEVKAEIKTYLSKALTKKFIDDIAQKISSALSEGNTKAAQKLMDKIKLKWKDIGWVKRDSDKVKVNIINQVFALKKPENSPTYGVYRDDTHSAVLKLSAVKTSKSVSDGVLASVFLNFESEEFFRSILETLHKNIDIEIFTDKL